MDLFTYTENTHRRGKYHCTAGGQFSKMGLDQKRKMELFSRRRWTTGTTQKSHMYGIIPCICCIIFFWMGHSRPIFLYFRLFYSWQYTNVLYKSFDDDWIRTADFWCWKRLLYQLSHNHCPTYFIGFDINTTTYRLDRYSLLPKSSMVEPLLIPDSCVYFCRNNDYGGNDDVKAIFWRHFFLSLSFLLSNSLYLSFSLHIFLLSRSV